MVNCSGSWCWLTGFPGTAKRTQACPRSPSGARRARAARWPAARGIFRDLVVGKGKRAALGFGTDLDCRHLLRPSTSSESHRVRSKDSKLTFREMEMLEVTGFERAISSVWA